MEPPLRNASFQTTVKCSSCAQDIELSSIAEHVCSALSNGQSASVTLVDASSHHASYRAISHTTVIPHAANSNAQRTTVSAASQLQANAPDLGQDRFVSFSGQYVQPKRIHHHMLIAHPGRSGLHPSEAASIAHDLGLPSPISAGGSGRNSPHQSRSRSRSRKASTPRPPSTDIPLSQDCAFPPFPMKPKRSQTDRDVSSYKPRSTSRAAIHPKPMEQSSIYSSSSSGFSASNGPLKRRVSNTSSNQRSRQGTIDDSASAPSTTTSSPRQSVFSMPLSREQSIEQSHKTPPLVSSETSVLSDPASSVSAGMPPTPLWPSHPIQPPVRMADSPEPEGEHLVVESTASESELAESHKVRDFDTQVNGLNTFDKILRPEQLRTSVDMFDNPPREPGYKAKRPPPLPQPQRRNTDDIAGPRSARIPAGPQTGGLTRTLTNLFRKRSQSTSSKKMPLPTIDSPRMRALAPEPPPIPAQEASQWDDIAVTDDAEGLMSPSPAGQFPGHILPRGDSLGAEGTEPPRELSPTQLEEDSDHGGQVQFDFKFSDEDPKAAPKMRRNSLTATEIDPSEVLQPTDLTSGQTDADLQRASMDSASSYGSIGFSNRTTSSRSSFPPSDDMRRKASGALDSENSQPTHEASTTPSVSRNHEIPPESPTDPLYRHGRLSPVPEAQAVRWPLAADHGSEPEPEPEAELEPEQEQDLQPTPEAEQEIVTEVETPASASPRKKLLPPINDMDTIDRPRDMRPATPGAVKGRCRGCSNLILAGQKSVASADGRLTGRYHKECFVCQTCKETFSTADFYVHDDHPYCAHHYHVINNTLCTGCGKGIEGQYLETHDVTGGGSKKFHHKCLQCSTCRVQLHDDYFEFHGRVYCERDAFRAANGPRSPYDTVPSRPSPLVREYISSGEPGLKGRFPERRTTRLIMT